MSSSDFDEAACERDLLALIESDCLLPRRHSYVGMKGRYFFKIPRLSGDVRRDVKNPLAHAAARHERDAAVQLHRLDAAVLAPAAVLSSYACLIYDRLSSPDVAELLRSRISRDEKAKLLRDSVCLLARLHRATPPPGLAKADEAELGRRAGLKAVQVYREDSVVDVEGMDIRNLKAAQNGVVFFDPHHIKLGVAEENLARFITTVLMLNWGSAFGFLPWTNLHISDLVMEYEKESARSVDRDLLRKFLLAYLIGAVAYAASVLAHRPLAIRLAGAAYARTFSFLSLLWLGRCGL